MSSIKVMILKQNIPVNLGNGIVSAIHCINVCVCMTEVEYRSIWETRSKEQVLVTVYTKTDVRQQA